MNRYLIIFLSSLPVILGVLLAHFWPRAKGSLKQYLRVMKLAKLGWRQVPCLQNGQMFYAKVYSPQYTHFSANLELAEAQEKKFAQWNPKPISKVGEIVLPYIK